MEVILSFCKAAISYHTMSILALEIYDNFKIMITGSRQTLSTAPRPQFKTSQQMLLQRDHRSSSSSLLSLSGIRTPKAPRRASKIGSGTVTIRSASIRDDNL